MFEGERSQMCGARAKTHACPRLGVYSHHATKAEQFKVIMFTTLCLTRFQGFSNRTEIPIRPLTLIFGPNASGKSSIIRSLLLAKQSLGTMPQISSRKIGFEYEGSEVSLASFANVVFKHEEKSSFTIELGLDCEPDIEAAATRRLLRNRDSAPRAKTLINLDEVVEHISSSWEVSIKKPISALGISFKFSGFDKPVELKLNLIEQVVTSDKMSLKYDLTIENIETLISLIRKVIPSADAALVEDERLPDVRDAIPGNNEAIHGSFKSKFEEEVEYIDELTDDLDFDLSDNFIRISLASSRDSIIAQNLSQLLSYQQFKVQRHLRGTRHIGPLREIAKRLTYDAGSITALDDENPEILFEPLENEVSNWLFDLTDGRYRLSPIESYLGNARFLGSLKSQILTDTRTGTPVTFQDVGVGLSQILPILELVSRASALKQQTLMIEQPELHLHPKMQANLVDLFITFIQNTESRRTILLETHSEAMLLRVQKRIREGSLDPNSVQVIYVDQTPESPDSPKGEGNFAFALPLDENGDFIMPMPNSFSSLRFEDLI